MRTRRCIGALTHINFRGDTGFGAMMWTEHGWHCEPTRSITIIRWKLHYRRTGDHESILKVKLPDALQDAKAVNLKGVRQLLTENPVEVTEASVVIPLHLAGGVEVSSLHLAKPDCADHYNSRFHLASTLSLPTISKLNKQHWHRLTLVAKLVNIAQLLIASHNACVKFCPIILVHLEAAQNALIGPYSRFSCCDNSHWISMCHWHPSIYLDYYSELFSNKLKLDRLDLHRNSGSCYEQAQPWRSGSL